MKHRNVKREILEEAQSCANYGELWIATANYGKPVGPFVIMNPITVIDVRTRDGHRCVFIPEELS